MFRENILFIREALTEFHTTGAILPTSRWAAEALIQPLRDHSTPKRILELGPGSGPVTVRILEEMIAGDKLTVCEINPRFMASLKKRLKKHPAFQRNKASITFFCGPAQDLPEIDTYDFVFCALPFVNFDLCTVREIFDKIKRLSRAQTIMTYYEYIGLRSIGKVLSPPKRKRRLKELDGFFDELRSRHSIDRSHVWLNVLPIHVYAVQMAA